MKIWSFRLNIKDEVEAETELEARQAWLQMVSELGIKWYATEKDLTLVS